MPYKTITAGKNGSGVQFNQLWISLSTAARQKLVARECYCGLLINTEHARSISRVISHSLISPVTVMIDIWRKLSTILFPKIFCKNKLHYVIDWWLMQLLGLVYLLLQSLIVSKRLRYGTIFALWYFFFKKGDRFRPIFGKLIFKTHAYSDVC
jgi:hypothetical protein